VVSPSSDAEVIGRSLAEPEAFGLIYDRHAPALLRFLGRRAGAKVAEGLFAITFVLLLLPLVVREPATRAPVSA
jgi:RNA polymerase sigma-70 factor (ECF subfamily)